MDDAMTEYDAINAGWPRCIIDLAAEKRRGGDEMAAERARWLDERMFNDARAQNLTYSNMRAQHTAALVEMSRNARPSLWSRFFP